MKGCMILYSPDSLAWMESPVVREVTVNAIMKDDPGGLKMVHLLSAAVQHFEWFLHKCFLA